MSIPTPAIDRDLEKLLDDAVPPPACEWREKASDEPCGAPATWIMSAACGHSAYFDEEHAASIRHIVESGGANYCANDVAPPRHPRMVKADPIRFDRIES